MPFTWTQQSWLSQVLSWGPGAQGSQEIPCLHQLIAGPKFVPTRAARLLGSTFASWGGNSQPILAQLGDPRAETASEIPVSQLVGRWISGYLWISYDVDIFFSRQHPFSHPIPVLDHSRSSTPAVEHRPVQRPPRSSRTCPHPGHLWSVEVQGKICEAVADQQIHLAIDSFNSLAALDSFAGCSEKPPLDAASSESHCLAGK